ncbi:N(6)-adenine-specific methyltransferase METTL4 [Hyalella azteca]|uniref:N(6)-adenine-specific methyltransferase METTL4 n=1 Tax=Hyalella azteca TaxID=294128 RepID=A0A8B7NV77_HYAAZ|nr:N(6)-adenine-specific methyltransferase METTL4 [Hyalella azteca]
MSILHRSSMGLILDHYSWIRKLYFPSKYDTGDVINKDDCRIPTIESPPTISGGCTAGNGPTTIALDGDDGKSFPLMLQLFRIRTPFMMDGAAEKRAKMLELHEHFETQTLTHETRQDSNPEQQRQVTEHLSSQEKLNDLDDEPKVGSTSLDELQRLGPDNAVQVLRKNRKRKRKHVSQLDDELSQEAASVMARFQDMANLPEYRRIFEFTPSSSDFRQNNKSAREAASRVLDCTGAAEGHKELGAHGSNEAREVATVAHDGSSFLLPPRCSYWQADVRTMTRVLPRHQRYKVVVMDPPWWNKHVKRAKKSRGHHHGYDMMSVSDLLDLPLRSILQPDSVVLVWATNNRACLKQFTQQIESQWNLTIHDTLFWMKVTQGGCPVTSPDEGCHGKLPYERLIVATSFQRLPPELPPRHPSELPPRHPSELPQRLPSDLPKRHPSDLPQKHPSELPKRLPFPRPDDTRWRETCTNEQHEQNTNYYQLSIRQDRNFSFGEKFLDVVQNVEATEKETSLNSCRDESNQNQQSSSSNEMLDTAQEGDEDNITVCSEVQKKSTVVKLEKNKKMLLVSVPSALHSHKPPLNDLVREFGFADEEDACLELFARCLVPGWHSLGLEVLRLQLEALYEPSTTV